MNLTQIVLENITDFINATTVNSEEASDYFLTPIFWIIAAIILLLCIAASGFR